MLTAVARGDLHAVTDVAIVQEIFHRYGSLGRWDVADKVAMNLLRIVPVILPITLEDIYTTAELSRLYGPSQGSRPAA